MSALTVIGVDPGPVPGIVVLRVPLDGQRLSPDDLDVVQCTRGVLWHVLDALVDAELDVRPMASRGVLVAAEKFVARGRLNLAQRRTLDQVSVIERVYGAAGRGPEVRCVLRPASAVKPWATDERLRAAGLLGATKGMRHARDAGRHALFAAVRDGSLPDPLSKRTTPSSPSSKETSR